MELSPHAVVLWNSVVVAVPPTLLALGTLISSIKNGKKVDIVTTKAQETTTAATNLHADTNINIIDLKAEMSLLGNKLEDLQTTMSKVIRDHQLHCLNFKPDSSPSEQTSNE